MTSALHAEGHQFDPGQVYLGTTLHVHYANAARTVASIVASIGFVVAKKAFCIRASLDAPRLAEHSAKQFANTASALRSDGASIVRQGRGDLRLEGRGYLRWLGVIT